MKLVKRLMCSALAAAALLAGAPAFAAEAPKTASTWRHSIAVEGNFTHCWNEAGKETFWLSYGGSVYAPLRTAAEWMGKDLAKSPDGKTYSLSGSKTPIYHDSAESIYDNGNEDEYRAKVKAPVPVTVLTDAKLLLDGSTVELKDAAGKPVSMIAWDGDPYLPVRSAAELLGMGIKWVKLEGRTAETIYLRTPITDEQVKECQQYVSALNIPAMKFREVLAGQQQLMGKYTSKKETVQKAVDECLALVKAFQETPRPDCGLLNGYYAKFDEMSGQITKGCETVAQLLQSNASIEQIRYVMYDNWTGEGYDPANPSQPILHNGVVRVCNDMASRLPGMSDIISEGK